MDKNKNMQLKVLELAFTTNVVRKKNFSNEGKDRKSTISKLFKLNLTTFIFKYILKYGIFSRIK